MVSSVMSFQLRARWATDTWEEAGRLGADGPPEARVDLLDAVEEMTASLTALWGRVEGQLHRTGLPMDQAAQLGQAVEAAVATVLQTIDLLNSPAEGGDAEARASDLTARLIRVRDGGRRLRRLGERRLPPIDPERMRRSQEAMERGEGRDVDDLLRELADSPTRGGECGPLSPTASAGE